VVAGIAGGVKSRLRQVESGLLLVQMAHHPGARVIGSVSSEEKAELARESDADDAMLDMKPPERNPGQSPRKPFAIWSGRKPPGSCCWYRRCRCWR
jgi:NADPH-dependent curcumin reductase CurA